MSVTIEPLPANYRAIPAHWRPMPPPPFDGEASRDDVEIAVAFLEDLAVSHQESYVWHGGADLLARLRARLEA